VLAGFGVADGPHAFEGRQAAGRVRATVKGL